MGKKASDSIKRSARRIDPEAKVRDTKPKEVKVEAEPRRMPERIREKDSGFGVIKIVAVVIIVLIVGSGALLRLRGGDEVTRGDKIADELCESTQECEKGLICYSYKGSENRCMTTCSGGDKCEPGFTCTSAAERAGRKSTRVRAVCVENAKL